MQGCLSLLLRRSDYLHQTRDTPRVSCRHFSTSTTHSRSTMRSVNKNTSWRTVRTRTLSVGGRSRNSTRRPSPKILTQDVVATSRHAFLLVDPRGSSWIRRTAPGSPLARGPRAFFLRLLPRRRSRANFPRFFRDARTSDRPWQPSVGCVETRLINEDGRHLSAPAAAVVFGRFVDPRVASRVANVRGGGPGVRGCVRRKEQDTGKGLKSLCCRRTDSEQTNRSATSRTMKPGCQPPVASPTPTPTLSGGCCLSPPRRHYSLPPPCYFADK